MFHKFFMTTTYNTVYGSLTRTFDNGDVFNDFGTFIADEVVSEKIAVQGDHKTPSPYFVSNVRNHRSFGVKRCVTYGYTDSGNLHQVATVPNSLVSSTPLADILSESEDKALLKFTQIMRGRDSKIGHNLLIDVFESPELKRLIRQLDDILKSMKRRRFLKLLGKASPAVVAAEYYLMWKFGIEPLITSLTEILHTLNNGMVNSEQTIKATSNVTVSSSGVSAYSSGIPFGYEASTSVRTSFQAGLGIEDIEKVLMHQFGLLTPGSSFYAVLPLSFVLDWFINVGQYLNTVEYLASNTGVSLNNLFKSQKIVTLYRNTCKGAYRDDFGIDWVIDEQSFGHTRSFRRSLLTHLPNPHLPSFKPRLNGGKVLSLVALITSIFHR